jgi:hypothetical protein
MKRTLREEYSEKFQSIPTLPIWADLNAISVWEKIAFCCYKANFHLHENTVTQDLIYSFWQLAQDRKLPVQIYQATSERVNGNDIELAIQTQKGYLLFPCQAKMVSRNGRYPNLRHKVGGQYQLDLLLEYGKNMGAIPIYLFYNFSNDAARNKAFERLNSLKIERLGCSVFPAEFIKSNFHRGDRWSIPDFYKLHRLLAIPFSNLFQLINSTTIPGLSLHDFNSSARYYTEEELVDKNWWRKLAPQATIGFIQQENPLAKTTQQEENESSYRPAFRILLPIERRRTALYSN